MKYAKTTKKTPSHCIYITTLSYKITLPQGLLGQCETYLTIYTTQHCTIKTHSE